MAAITFEISVSEEKAPLLRSFLMSNDFQFLERVCRNTETVPYFVESVNVKQEEDASSNVLEIENVHSNMSSSSEYNEMTVTCVSNESSNLTCPITVVNSQDSPWTGYQDIIHKTGIFSIHNKEIEMVSPKDIAVAIEKWLRVTGISQKYFATTVLNRQQSTLSEIFKKAPEKWPDGRGRWVYEKMFQFAIDIEEQEKVYNSKKCPPSRNSCAFEKEGKESAARYNDQEQDNDHLTVTIIESSEDKTENEQNGQVDEATCFRTPPPFSKKSYKDIVHKTGLQLIQNMNILDVTPKCIAHSIDIWLRTTGISQKLFASCIINRQQSSLSDILKRASDKWPDGRGRWVYERMYQFLTSFSEQQNMYEYRRALLIPDNTNIKKEEDSNSKIEKDVVAEEFLTPCKDDDIAMASIETENNQKVYHEVLSNLQTPNRIEYSEIIDETCVGTIQNQSLTDVTPRDIALLVDKWLRVTGTSQKYFATTVLNRQQSTLSEILKKAPDKWPDRRGRWVYERMYQFLLSYEEQEQIYSQKKDFSPSMKRTQLLPASSGPTVEIKKLATEEPDENYVPSFTSMSCSIDKDNCDTFDINDKNDKNDKRLLTTTPKDIAYSLLEWLKLHRVSQAFFARNVLDRQQSTLSGLITNASEFWPKGNGKIPYIKMLNFLNNKDQQEELLLCSQTKHDTSKGCETDLKYIHTPGTGQRVAHIRRSMFCDSQKAALDNFFLSNDGRLSSESTLEVANALGMKEHQVKIWFQNHRRLKRAGAYNPGQYQIKDHHS